MAIQSGDIIKVGRHSYAQIQLVNEVTLNLNPLTTFKAVGSEEKQKLTFSKKSNLRIIGEGIAEKVKESVNGKEMEIETPSSLAGIRGTDFKIKIDETGNTEYLLNETFK